jgi:hypothetical protein
MRRDEEGITAEAYFGVCPCCGLLDGRVNILADPPDRTLIHWAKCDRCRTRWVVGWNLLGRRPGETDEVLGRHWESIRGYRAGDCASGEN